MRRSLRAVPPALALRRRHGHLPGERDAEPLDGRRSRQRPAEHDEPADIAPAVEAAQAIEVDGVDPRRKAGGTQRVDRGLLADEQQVSVASGPVQLAGP